MVQCDWFCLVVPFCALRVCLIICVYVVVIFVKCWKGFSVNFDWCVLCWALFCFATPLVWCINFSCLCLCVCGSVFVLFICMCSCCVFFIFCAEQVQCNAKDVFCCTVIACVFVCTNDFVCFCCISSINLLLHYVRSSWKVDNLSSSLCFQVHASSTHDQPTWGPIFSVWSVSFKVHL